MTRMKRREFLSVLAAGVTVAGPALAQDYVESIIAQLREQGFQSITQERTLLGRIRIVARRSDGRREIIVNPRSGEILRDLWTPVSGRPGKIDIIDEKASGPSGGADGGNDGGGDDGGGDDGGGDKGGGDDDGDDDGGEDSGSDDGDDDDDGGDEGGDDDDDGEDD